MSPYLHPDHPPPWPDRVVHHRLNRDPRVAAWRYTAHIVTEPGGPEYGEEGQPSVIVYAYPVDAAGREIDGTVIEHVESAPILDDTPEGPDFALASLGWRVDHDQPRVEIDRGFTIVSVVRLDENG